MYWLAVPMRPCSTRAGARNTCIYRQGRPNYGMSMDEYVPAEIWSWFVSSKIPRAEQRLLGSSTDVKRHRDEETSPQANYLPGIVSRTC